MTKCFSTCRYCNGEIVYREDGDKRPKWTHWESNESCSVARPVFMKYYREPYYIPFWMKFIAVLLIVLSVYLVVRIL